MSIELLQTMEWSRLCWDQSFEKLMELDSILPKVGETYSVKFENNEDFVQEGHARILWQPPHSELNGWSDKRPTEILKSYVIEGKLKNSSESGLAFDLEVLNRIKLVDYFNRIDEEKRSPLSYVGQSDGTSKIQWQDARRILKAKVGDYIYLSGSDNETRLEVILSYRGDSICLHYSATLPVPSFYETKITKYYLDNNELQLFRRLVSDATHIDDESDDMLMEKQIYGAEYW
ncbi:MAG: hypothetical protein COB04_11600 [Gammaproteobacteria bacterium]|nr:MAG: hypothetical protein COB04_11600 [Gammaproteobacteria bacterium]